MLPKRETSDVVATGEGTLVHTGIIELSSFVHACK